tara:strand:+ start:20774 stop:21355 length:582 start_codon:yes stop_codon:yes gene_type:complete
MSDQYRTNTEILLHRIAVDQEETKKALQTDGSAAKLVGKFDSGGRSTMSDGTEAQMALTNLGHVIINDGGNAVTVDGTVTANLSATDNAVLDTIDAVLDTIKVDTESIETSNKLSLGDNGCVMINGNAAQSESAGTYFAVQFLKACTPTTLTIGSSTTVTGQEVPAGTIIYGDITAITGDSGALYVLYKGNPA